MSARDTIAIMGARETIALARHSQACDGGYSVVGGPSADAAIEALTAAGYRIIAPGELDRETLERAAKVAVQQAPATQDWADAPFQQQAHQTAAAIRALTGKAGEA